MQHKFSSDLPLFGGFFFRVENGGGEKGCYIDLYSVVADKNRGLESELIYLI